MIWHLFLASLLLLDNFSGVQTIFAWAELSILNFTPASDAPDSILFIAISTNHYMIHSVGGERGGRFHSRNRDPYHDGVGKMMHSHFPFTTYANHLFLSSPLIGRGARNKKEWQHQSAQGDKRSPPVISSGVEIMEFDIAGFVFVVKMFTKRNIYPSEYMCQAHRCEYRRLKLTYRNWTIRNEVIGNTIALFYVYKCGIYFTSIHMYTLCDDRFIDDSLWDASYLGL